ncbi:MAG: hypothetical protein M1511_07675 [Deltaproteobacteria bacterium]|nr:hypothetical protein [Deltaproteobacteria bacterium]
MNRFVWLLIVILGLLFAVSQAFAWDVSINGDYLWAYDYFDQYGHAGFFGTYDSPNVGPLMTGTYPKFNTMNGFVGMRTINGVQYGLVTGTDASMQWSRMEFAPEIKVNNAVTFKAMYQIGYGTNDYGLYENSTALGVYNPIASGTWTYWWFNANLPWGHLNAGKRPLIWGMGGLFDQHNATTEAIGPTVFYGPLRAAFVVYPWRGQTWQNSMAGQDIVSTTLSVGPQILNPGENGAETAMSYRMFDNDRKRNLHPEAWFIYSNGNIEFGVLAEYIPTHNGPAGATTNANTLTARTYDQTYVDGSAYFKYNNGKFFFNNELAWWRVDRHVQPAYNELNTNPYLAGSGSPFSPYYNESWKYFADCGVMSGPAKLTLFYSWIPGPDRRAGIWINKQSWENVSNGATYATTQMFRPYSLLMAYQYGAGLNAIDTNGEGYMTDASSLAARLDYALAANLNIYGTFFYANRVSKGWGWGSLTPASDGNGGGSVILLGQQLAPGSATIFPAPQNDILHNSPAPSIPDDALGWEVSLGADWKLLENLTTRFRCAYWQPGAWFKYACVDKNLAGTVKKVGTVTYLNPQPGDGPFGWAVNPNREIQGIFGFQGMMEVIF